MSHLKTLCIFTIIVCFGHYASAQNSGYVQLWKEVTKMENNGLPKSALKIVEQISDKAKTEKNAPQLIKSLLFKSKYALSLEEDSQMKIVTDFKAEIAISEAPEKQILQNMLATMYWQYFQQNRYKFYKRTNTAEKVNEEDFRTWDLQTLFDEIHFYYQSSLENPQALKQTPIENFADIITEDKGSRNLRPTLFDILAQNALTFYTTPENSITKPAYKFEIDNPNLMAVASEFSKLNLQSKDSTSLQLNALQIYQDLTVFHLEDKTADALVDVDINRLEYVNQNAIFDEKESVFLSTLESSRDSRAPDATAALYAFEIANLYYKQGSRFNSKTNEEPRWKLKEAMQLCKTTIKTYPKSVGSKKCEALKKTILNQTINITSESVIPVDQFSKVLLHYANLSTIEFSIYDVGITEITTFNNIYDDEKKLNYLSKKPVAEQWSTNLKDEGDYQTHATEIIFPKLKNGHYIILAKTKNKSNTFAVQTVQVTDFALVDNSSEENIRFQIINRNNGKPLSNVSAEIRFQNDYNSNFKTEQLTSDSNGFISFKKTEQRYMNLSVALTKDNDTGYFEGFYAYRNYNNEQPEVTYTSFLFTDRSIYRPGQTVYFKGIVIKTDKETSEVLADENVSVNLYNVNGEDLNALNLMTNEFGSVSGEFILPNDGLNGDFRIEISSEARNRAFQSNQYFSVEEYKRPKFETQFKPVTDTFKVNDSVKVKGSAMAYAGSNITDAKVVYRVTRKVQYPRWYYYYRPWFSSEPQEISNGETTTNTKGEFEITFKAQPDESVDKSSLPIFNYEITADVTDLNGETRSATIIVNVGYHALLATISVDEKLDKTNKDHKININTRNLNGQFVAAEGHIKIFKLKAPERVLRPRPWQAPDYQVISKEEFTEKFPHDAYTDEANSENWEKGKLVFESDFNTEKSKDVSLGNLKKWASGSYLIVLESEDKFGQMVKDEARTTLFSEEDKSVADNQLFAITTNKNSYAAGENVEITLGSAAKDIVVTVKIEKNEKIVKTFIVPLNNSKQTLAIPVTKEDIGGFAIHYSLAAFNSFLGSTLNINVPYPKTDLEIETLSFRDKLQPGVDETWSFKIKGPKGDKVSAEVLASMYDASLDQFKPHNWSFNPLNMQTYYPKHSLSARQSFGTNGFRIFNPERNYFDYPSQGYDQLDWFGFYFGNNYRYEMKRNLSVSAISVENVEAEMDEVAFRSDAPNANLDKEMTRKFGGVVVVKDSTKNFVSIEEKEKFNNIQIRKNLQETAFFFPKLQTDTEGNVSFNFTTPEALTQWKLQLLAHTKTLESAVTNFETVTQKELMVIPNTPRFLRQGDEITISTKIANLTERDLSGEAKLILTDAVSGEDMTTKLLGSSHQQELEGASFSVSAKGNTQVSWKLTIPDDVNAVQYKILARAGDFSDGEQNALPVLTNRMLVTETLPMWIRSNETKSFTMDKLKTNNSKTLKNHNLTLEITSNPAWYAVQALPYLMEYPYDCNEQTFSRYYANALASHIANSNPRIQDVFNQWASQDALISNLEKNEELKNILIQETPWLRDAQSETEQKKRIALLFDMNKMKNELESAKRKLQINQMENGAWPWFNGGQPNRFITQHIVTGFGHLGKLSVIPKEQVTSDEDSHNLMIQKAIAYLDSEFVQTYKNIKKYDEDVDLSKDHLSFIQLHYLYMRSFYPQIKKSKEVQKITDYYQTQIQKYWLSRSLYAKGLMTMVTYRMEDNATTKKILNSLKETSITSEELGMYWKENTSSWYWHQAPVETQALMIEVFSEAGTLAQADLKNLEDIDNLKIWLLKNKQTNKWETTKATTEAVYALLLQGSDWLSVTEMVDVVIGGQQIEPSKLEDVKVEAGTGYYKTAWSAGEIKPEMATVKLTKKGDGIAWGSLYWQYFEDLDKITTAETPLKLKKKLFKKTNSDAGEVITEITSKTELKIGDLVRVRIELQSDRDMEYIHMKDMRAAGLEPVNVLSEYKYQDGLGYYESTKDASTNFFFDVLPKGVYVFEYDLRVNNAGNMSNGITTVQSMYAPEFSSHSEGIRISVD